MSKNGLQLQQLNQIEETPLSLRVVRRIAARYKLRIHKSRAPFSLTNRGQFQLIDSGGSIIGGTNYEMTMDEIMDYLTALRWN